MNRSILAALLVAAPFAAHAADSEVSVERGLYVSITHGCNDCHTANYNESNGQVDPALALKGTAIGWQGPWGTTYPMNLRITASTRSEDEFVTYMKNLKTRPPMPFYNVNAMQEAELRSLYLYIKSLGEPGDQAPEATPPGVEPKTPYYPLVPPTMPKG
jgi:mono/diheme cytochrome c family protein